MPRLLFGGSSARNVAASDCEEAASLALLPWSCGLCCVQDASTEYTSPGPATSYAYDDEVTTMADSLPPCIPAHDEPLPELTLVEEASLKPPKDRPRVRVR
mmetsp:Transcript_124855/g.249318  ORF Transcript_124855/g.249318 Transcript_124855/m.249318 type:complete len:101 (-) Transcript_124855:74-376(-)